MKEAHKYWLRGITKARWDALHEEYIVYKQSLVDEVASAETRYIAPIKARPTTSAANLPHLPPSPNPDAEADHVLLAYHWTALS